MEIYDNDNTIYGHVTEKYWDQTIADFCKVKVACSYFAATCEV